MTDISRIPILRDCDGDTEISENLPFTASSLYLQSSDLHVSLELEVGVCDWASKMVSRQSSTEMTYEIIQPPFTLKFRDMSKQELEGYRQWFLNALPARAVALQAAVHARPGFEDWAWDYSVASIVALGRWLAQEVETRPRTPTEATQIRARAVFDVDVSGEELTNRTFSIAMDVGMYLAEALLHCHPQLRWEQPLRDKKFADFGQMVLVGFGSIPLNPVRIAVTLCYGIASGKQTGARLREIFDYWSKMADAASTR